MKAFGLMFHRFCDETTHKKTEGSISKTQLKKNLNKF